MSINFSTFKNSSTKDLPLFDTYQNQSVDRKQAENLLASANGYYLFRAASIEKAIVCSYNKDNTIRHVAIHVLQENKLHTQHDQTTYNNLNDYVQFSNDIKGLKPLTEKIIHKLRYDCNEPTIQPYYEKKPDDSQYAIQEEKIATPLPQKSNKDDIEINFNPKISEENESGFQSLTFDEFFQANSNKNYPIYPSYDDIKIDPKIAIKLVKPGYYFFRPSSIENRITLCVNSKGIPKHYQLELQKKGKEFYVSWPDTKESPSLFSELIQEMGRKLFLPIQIDKKLGYYDFRLTQLKKFLKEKGVIEKYPIYCTYDNEDLTLDIVTKILKDTNKDSFIIWPGIEQIKEKNENDILSYVCISSYKSKTDEIDHFNCLIVWDPEEKNFFVYSNKLGVLKSSFEDCIDSYIKSHYIPIDPQNPDPNMHYVNRTTNNVLT